MVKRNRLPTAAEVWEQIPLPAMAREPLDMRKVGLHVFRLCEGVDIFGEKVMVVECRDILGFATEFTESCSGVFDSHKEAVEFLDHSIDRARNEYNRLKKQFEKRGGYYE